MDLERTAEAQRGFDGVTGELPITLGNVCRHVTLTDAGMCMACHVSVTVPGPRYKRIGSGWHLVEQNGAAMDPFDDDTPIVAACDLENPESCESCQ